MKFPIEKIGCVYDLLVAHPVIVVDVGAANGVIRHFDFNSRRTDRIVTKFYAFEASPEEFQKLSDNAYTQYFNIAIADEQGRFPFYKRSTVGSLVKRHDREAVLGETFDQIEVDVDTIANLRDKNALPRIDVLKSDVERNDLSVLKGAGSYLREILCVQSEFSFSKYDEHNNFANIDRLLTDHDFFLLSISSRLGDIGELAGGDLLYLRSVESILNSELPHPTKKINATKLLVIILSFNLIEYAYFVAKSCYNANLYMESEFSEIKNALTSAYYAPNVAPFSLPIFANLLSMVSEVLSGPRWISKATPKSNRLYRFNRLLMKTNWLYRKDRNVNYLERKYDRISRMSDVRREKYRERKIAR